MNILTDNEGDGLFAIYPSLREKTVLITGGASGIGAEMVKSFTLQGARVAFLDVDDSAAENLLAQMEGQTSHRPLFVHCDLTDIAALRAAVAKVVSGFGPIRVLLNNAANDDRHEFDRVTAESFDHCVEVNLRHHFFATQAVKPGMAEAGGGSVINMSSISWMRPVRDLSIYAAAKAAVIGLTRSLARDLGSLKIRVNAITPGWTLTRQQTERFATPARLDAVLEEQCLKFHIDPQAVARVALFLAAADSNMCTGQNFIVDAGTT